jgi:hypothetical protein
MVTALAGEPLELRAGRWEGVLSHPSRTLLGGSASRPPPPHRRDVPVHFPNGLGTGPLPVIVSPPAAQRVALWDHLTGPGLGLGVDRGASLTPEGFDTLRWRPGEGLPAVLPNRLAENINALADRREAGLGRREGSAPLPEELFDHRFGFRGEPFGCPARADDVIRLADQMDLVPPLERRGGGTVRR